MDAPRIFVSWSGGLALDVARIVASWLGYMFNVECFVSKDDIAKGASWPASLSEELATAVCAVVCVTPENLGAPWLHTEIGALTRSFSNDDASRRVAPLLIGEIADEQLLGAMPLLQHTRP